MDETLLSAAEKGHLKTVQALLKKGIKLTQPTAREQRPLCWPVYTGIKTW